MKLEKGMIVFHKSNNKKMVVTEVVQEKGNLFVTCSFFNEINGSYENVEFDACEIETAAMRIDFSMPPGKNVSY